MREHKMSEAEMAEAKQLCEDWAADPDCSNRYKADKANILLTALALTAHRMTIAPAPLAERREAVISGAAEMVTDDWDEMVIGVTTPNIKVQRRLMSALALVGVTNVRLDWVRIEDKWYIVRTG